MLILGIETSCDETSVSVVKDGKEILSLVTFSQIEIHKLYDGVVPEVASRNHLIKILPIMKQALNEAKISLKDINAIAVSNKPGLIGSLLVGINFAKGIAWSYKLPIIYVNHIKAHIYSVFFSNDIIFPVLALVISGGHTLLYEINSFNDFILIGRTVDDAVGEALDKGAKLLGLGYPGGPIMEKYAESGKNDYLKFPVPKIKKGNFHFSYSGLKTSLLTYLNNNTKEEVKNNFKDIIASYQQAAFIQLLQVVKRGLDHTKIKNLIVCGGVSANTYLRELFNNDMDLKNENINIYFPEKKLCGDNAAMIAGLAEHYYGENKEYNIEKLYENAYSRVVKKGRK